MAQAPDDAAPQFSPSPLLSGFSLPLCAQTSKARHHQRNATAAREEHAGFAHSAGSPFHGPASNPLLSSHVVHRAVDVQLGARAWPTAEAEEEAWGEHAATWRNNNEGPAKELELIQPMKQLSVLHFSNQPEPARGLLPALPAHLECTSFSWLRAQQEPIALWSGLQTELKAMGVIVGEKEQFQLLCCTTGGVRCCEFSVRAYDGHFREAGKMTQGQSPSQWSTIELQRRDGCCVGMMAIFRKLTETLQKGEKPLQIESRLALSSVPPSLSSPSTVAAAEPAASSAGSDAPMDLSLLPMPSLACTSLFSPDPALSADSSVFDTLLDLITSDREEQQLEGLNALALCLDGSASCRKELLREVAAKLASGKCEQVRRAAARVIAQAAASPVATDAVVQSCLPSVIEQLLCGISPSSAPKCPLRLACAEATRKSLLRSCLALCSDPGFQALLDPECATMRGSQLKKELLRLSASADEETRSLAVEAIRAIRV